MPPERQHDLARAIYGLPPTSGDVVNGGTRAYEIRALAAGRYAEDPQAVLDASSEGSSSSGGGGSGSPTAPRRASFVPLPSYNEASSLASTPRAAQHRRLYSDGALTQPHRPAHFTAPGTSKFRVPGAEDPPSSSNHPPVATTTFTALLARDSPTTRFIRETLYAALADILQRTPSLQRLISPTNHNAPRDRPRAYFACFAHALISVARTNTTSSLAPPGSAPSTTQPNPYLPTGPSPGATVLPPSIAVTGAEHPLTISIVPAPLQPLMERASLGQESQRMDVEDAEVAVHCGERGKRAREYKDGAGVCDFGGRCRCEWGGRGWAWG